MSLLIALGLAGALVQSVAPPSAAVSGRVLEEGSRTPVKGAQLWLSPGEPGAGAMPLPHQPRTAVTDPDGRYAFEDVEAGRYNLTVQKPGFALPSGLLMQEVTVAAGERREDVIVLLQKGAAIAGRVLDDSGEPVVDVRVVAMQSPRGAPNERSIAHLPLGGQGHQDQTNDLGEYRLFGLPAGEYIVQAMPTPLPEFGAISGRATMIVPTYFPASPDPKAAQTISVGAGQIAGDITIRMVGVAAFQVSGVALDEARRPVANAMVRLMANERAADSPFTMAPWNQVRTDASGRFSIANVPSGTYTLMAIAPVVLQGPHIAMGGQGPHIAMGGAVMGGPAMGGPGAGSFGISGGFVGGPGGGGITMETNGAGTFQYVDDMATQVPITIDQESVTGLEIVVRSQAQ
jgi:Carboxypeptidase regulatory-like domain